MALQTGSTIAGKYLLEQKASEGGQGTLWRAIDLRSRRHIAIKVFKHSGPENVCWPYREIKVLKRLSPSPYVVSVDDFGEQEGKLYLVVEWIDGSSLHQLLRPRPRLERVHRWSRQICLGLEHCHQHQVFHRDIKPSNIMITTADDAKLVDFGIARTTDSTMTFPGQPVGSVAYMPPERWRGERGDQLSDLYSFGCLLYELLTGDPPFGRMSDPSDIDSLRYRHLNVLPTPPKAGFSGIPDELDNLACSLLAKRTEDRPQSAREVADRLQEIVHPATGTTPMDRAVTGPHIDPGSVDRLLAADAAWKRTLEEHGPDHLLTLEARVELAEQVGRSGDRAGAIRAYDQIIPDYDRVCGPYDQRTQQVRQARMNWILGKVP